MSKSRELAKAVTVGRKNIIINGCMRVAQRGTSFTTSTSEYTLDRWKNVENLTTGAVDIAQTVSTLPAEVQCKQYYSLDVTTAQASVAAGELLIARNCPEGLDVQHLNLGLDEAETVTLSFWHAHTKTGTYCVSLRNAASDRSYVAEYTQTAANAWEKAEIVIPGETTGTWLTNTGIGINIAFAFAMGSTYHTTAGAWQTGNYMATSNQVNAMDNTANFCRLTAVQLEVGDVATEFEQRPFADELAMCQRYYEKSYDVADAPGGNHGKPGSYAVGLYESIVDNDWVFGTWPFKVKKRAAPTVSLYSNLAAGSAGYTNVNGTARASTASDVAENGWDAIRNVSGVTWTDSLVCSFHWTADAEL